MRKIIEILIDNEENTHSYISKVSVGLFVVFRYIQYMVLLYGYKRHYCPAPVRNSWMYGCFLEIIEPKYFLLNKMDHCLVCVAFTHYMNSAFHIFSKCNCMLKKSKHTASVIKLQDQTSSSDTAEPMLKLLFCLDI